MKISVDQRPLPPGAVTYNSGLGYGRLDRGNIEVHSYSFFAPRADLIDRFGAAYAAQCEDFRKDDELCGDPSLYAALGYGSLAEAFERPAELAAVVKGYLDRDIFEVYLPMTDAFEYVINSTDRVLVSSEGLLIEGRCFSYRDRPKKSSSAAR